MFRLTNFALILFCIILTFNACESDHDVFQDTMTDQDVSLENRDPLVGFDGDGYKGGVNQGWLSAQWLTIKDDPKFTPHESPEDPNSPPFTPYEPCFDCVQVVENQDVICTYIPIWRSNDQSVQSIMMAIEHKETGAIVHTVYMKNNLLKRNLGLDMLTLYSTNTREDIEIIKDQHFFSQTRLFCVMDHANFGNSDIGDIIDEVDRTGACPVDAKGKPLTDLSKDLECKWQIWEDCRVERITIPDGPSITIKSDCIYTAVYQGCDSTGGIDPANNNPGGTIIITWDPDPCDHPEKEDPKDEDETDPRGGGDFNGDEGNKNNTDKDENSNNHTGNCEDEEVDCADAQATYEALLGDCGNSNFDPCANPELMVWVEEFLANEDVSYPCNPGMTNADVVCEIIGGNSSSPSSIEVIVDDQFACVLENYPALFTAADLAFINSNSWIKKYLNEYLDNCGFDGDSERPDLGAIGNLLRSMLPYEESFPFFEHYWLGEGTDLTLSDDVFQDIINSLPDQNLWSGGTPLPSDPNLKEWLIRLPKDSPYQAALGNFTIITDLNGNPVGIVDTYDFNWNLDKVHNTGEIGNGYTLSSICGISDKRLFTNEWKTRAVSIASIASSASGSYNIKYP